MLCLIIVLFISNLVLISLEAAAAGPETLSQEAIIENLDPVEAARLDKVRNIGIAVYDIPLYFHDAIGL